MANYLEVIRKSCMLSTFHVLFTGHVLIHKYNIMSSLFCRSKTGKFHKKSGETFNTEVKDECTGDSAGTLRMSFTLCTVHFT